MIFFKIYSYSLITREIYATSFHAVNQYFKNFKKRKCTVLIQLWFGFDTAF